jgi:hypothetical protein
MKRRVTVPTVVFLCCQAGYMAGCGPQPPKLVSETPKDVPAEFGGRKLYHTSQAFIYARSDTAAGEADRWVNDVNSYIKRNYNRDLEKGIVLVMDPADPPIAQTLEDVHLLEYDSSMMTTQPRHPKSVAEVRKQMASEGIAERATVKGTVLALPRQKLQDMRLDIHDAAWAVAAPSHELAVECGIDVGAGGLLKKRPEWSEAQARKAASAFKDSFAKAFEITRGNPVFIAWVQRQSNWSDEQRREAILKYLRHSFTSNWLPAPKEEDLEW